MPEVEIQIGGRAFDVACQDGEEHYLLSAAKMLDEEASVLAAQIGRLPEARMLLMAGLMLADKTAGLEDKVREQEAELEKLRNQPKPAPERIEVPTIPAQVTDSFAEIAARAEAIAARLDEKTARA